MNRLLMACAAAISFALSASADVIADYRVVPLPRTINTPDGREGFTLDKNVTIIADEAQAHNATMLADYLNKLTGIRPTIAQEASGRTIRLNSDLASTNPDAYTINVGTNSITISGATPAATFHGIQTLRKAIGRELKAGETVTFPAGDIADYPEFGYRGMHLDVCRHFVTTDSVKRYIDMLALHNINRFHWHLTEDQGWRVEIRKYPRLTEVGSMRSGTMIGKDWDSNDGIPHGGFYTQDEIRDIVQYAADRHITIIPEIDLPGHMLGALTAYPALGCTGGPYAVWPRWGVSEDVLCAGNDKTLEFLDDVMTEILELFPSEYIHAGGDECPKTRWKECPKCQAKIAELGIKGDDKHSAEEYLQSYVMTHVEKFLNERGRKMIGWDEILEGGLSPNATVMSWRGEEGGREAVKQGHDAIMVPNQYFYFDFYQTKDRDNEPLAIGRCITVPHVYSYMPRPADLNDEEKAHIIGVQANVWTEYIPTFRQVEYMALPRMAALSEVQWTDPETKDYEDFEQRLQRLMNIYDSEGYNYAKHYKK